MIVVAGMIVLYGALWKLSPKSVAWYTWIEEVPMKGSVGVTGPVDIRQPSRGKLER
jgi:methionine synthase II (cobalamin-independent)